MVDHNFASKVRPVNQVACGTSKFFFRIILCRPLGFHKDAVWVDFLLFINIWYKKCS